MDRRRRRLLLLAGVATAAGATAYLLWRHVTAAQLAEGAKNGEGGHDSDGGTVEGAGEKRKGKVGKKKTKTTGHEPVDAVDAGGDASSESSEKREGALGAEEEHDVGLVESENENARKVKELAREEVKASMQAQSLAAKAQMPTAGHEAAPSIVGKKGTRWWYEGSKGLDRKAAIAAQQRAEQASKLITEQCMSAAQDGHSDILTRLIDQGWSVASRDKYGGTALHWASGKGRVDTVQLLLQRKADPLARLYKGGGRGRTALHYAARNGHLEVCKILVDQAHVPADAPTHDNTPPVHLAVWKGRLQAAEWLLSRVENLHFVNDYGCDTSHWAAMTGDVATAQWLISKGVTMQTANLVGHTCFHKAAQLGHTEFIKFLVQDLGINPREVAADGEGNSVADLAKAAQHLDLARWLESFT